MVTENIQRLALTWTGFLQLLQKVTAVQSWITAFLKEIDFGMAGHHDATLSEHFSLRWDVTGCE